MIEPAFLQTLRMLYERLEGQPVNWVVTGSVGMALQGLPLQPHDIDLQTLDEEGAHLIERRFAEFVKIPVRMHEMEFTRSYLGGLELNGIQVEIMGAMQKRVPGGGWEEPTDLPRWQHFARLEDMRIPVLSIAYEAQAYARLGRAEKAAMLAEWAREHNQLTSAINYRLISPCLATAGQPTREQIALAGSEGYQAIINLALATSDHAIPAESELCQTAGMEYIHIPVLWDDPHPSDLQRFFEEMDRRQGQNLFVHCAMNMRVSAFVFLYRVLRLGVPVDTARHEMEQIWQPGLENPTWQALIDQALA